MKRIDAVVVVIVVIALAAVLASWTADKPPEAPPVPTRLAEAPEKIYSDDPNDSWNRIFYYLFSRRVTAQLSSEFPDAAPFEKVPDFDFMHLEKSTRTFERVEIGDRAIDALYPSFLRDDGVRTVLKGTAYADFKKALEDGLADASPRDPMARAMMQSDLWSAYDIVSRYKHYELQGQHELAQRRLEVLDLLGQLVRKVALTPENIRTLPDNYAMARTKYALPDLFGDAGWVEVKWFPDRLHDVAADYRRATRVFLKPARAPKDMQKFLNDLRREDDEAFGLLDGVALVIQALLVDTRGDLEPANIVTEIQLRMFQKTGSVEKTQIGAYEVNRRLLRKAGSGFLVQEGEDVPVYFPAAGNDYSFASPNAMYGSAPMVVRQRTRCSFCHGQGLTRVMTFSVKLPPKDRPGPPVRQLDRAAHEAAEFVMSKKVGREDWKSLGKYFQK